MRISDFLKRLLHIQEDISSSENKIPHDGTKDSDANQPVLENDGTSCTTAGNGWEDAVEYLQIGFYDFTMEKGVIGFYLDPENRWIQLGREVFSAVAVAEAFYEKRMQEMRADTRGSRLKAKLEMLKQDSDVEAYGAQLTLPNLDAAVVLAVADDTPVEKGGENAGRPPFPFRTAFGILVAQSILGLSDRGICRMVSESPYIQWFLGYTSFSTGHTVDPSNLVHFRERLDIATMQEINAIASKHRSAAPWKPGLGRSWPTMHQLNPCKMTPPYNPKPLISPAARQQEMWAR